MDIHSLPQPYPSWPQSAQQAVKHLIALSVLQSEQMTLQSEQIEKRAARIAVLEERLRQKSRNSDKPYSSDRKTPPRSARRAQD